MQAKIKKFWFFYPETPFMKVHFTENLFLKVWSIIIHKFNDCVSFTGSLQEQGV